MVVPNICSIFVLDERKTREKLKFFENNGYKNEATLIFSERLKEIMKFMKRKLLTMLLLVAGATVCAQQKLTKSTPDLTNTNTEVPCREQIEFKFSSNEDDCDHIDLKIKTLHVPKGTTSVTWEVYNDKKRVAQGSLKQENVVDVGETISLPNLPKGTYTFKLIPYPSGCPSNPQTFRIVAKNRLTMQLSPKKQVLGCEGGCPQVWLQVEGGAQPYKYTYETLNKAYKPLCNGISNNCNGIYNSKNYIKPDEKDYCWDDLEDKTSQRIVFPYANTWVVSVKDARDCVIICDTVEINTRTAPKIGKITPQRCNSKDGKIPVKVDISSFGEGRLYYILDNDNRKKQELKDKQRSFTVDVDDAAPRTHKISLIDDYCRDDRTFEVPEPLTIIEKYTEGALNCNMNGDISAVVRVKGGNAPYYYTLEYQAKGSSAVTGVASEVAFKDQEISLYLVNGEGTYRFKIHDTPTNGCPKEEVIAEITLEKPTLKIPGELITATQYSCKGDKTLSKAKISIAESIRDIKKYKVAIFNSNNSNTNTPVAEGYEYTLPDYNGGSFYAEITDIETGCSTPTNKVIVKPAAQLEIKTEVVRAVSCDNDTEEIVIKAQPVRKGEQTTLHYSVTGTNNYNNEKRTSENEWRLTLPVGQYVITVTDEETGCRDVIKHQVKGRNVFVLKASQAVKATCASGEGTVTLTLVETGKQEVPVSPYFSYRVLSKLNNQEVTSGFVEANTTTLHLKGGTYVVGVTVKETGCTYTETVVIPENPTRIEVKATARVSSDCSNHKGEVEVNVSGGNAPYTVILTDALGKEVAREQGVTTNYVFTNLSPAKYTIKVSDASGCNEYQGDANVTVQPSFVMEAVTVATVKPITCERKEEVTVKVAVAPEYVKGTWLLYTIKKDGKEYQTKRLAATTLSLNGNNALPEGDYTIEVLNETTNCVVTTTYTVKSPETYSLELSDAVRATCANGEGTVTLTLHDTNKGRQVEGFSYRIVGNDQEEAKEVRGNTVVLRLKGGTYVVEVTVKETGCKLTKEVIIPENPTPIEVKATARVSSDCSNHKGEVEVNVSGGNAPYTVILTDALGKEVAREQGVTTNYVFTNLSPAKYTIKVSDASGCNEYQGDANVTVQPSFVMEAVTVATVKPITCERKEEVTVKVTVAPEYVKGTWLRYTIKKDGKEYKQIRLEGTTLSLNGNDALPVGDYTIEVLNETTNCVVTTTYTVKSPETYNLELSDAVRATCATDKGTVTLTLHDTNKGRQVEGFRYRVFKDAVMQEMNEVRGNTVVLRLKGGVYRVELTVKETGCKLTKEVIIPENPTPIEVKATSRVSSDCKNYNGEVEVNVSGGNAPYTVILTDASGKEVARKEGVNTNYVFADLAPAKYTIKVSDTSGCNEYQGDTNVTVQPSFVMEAVTVATVKPITCERNEEVTVKVIVAPEYVKGTWLRYTIKKDGKEYKQIRLEGTTLSLNGNDALPVGDYTIEVLNETTKCVVTNTYTVKSPETYSLELSDAVRATCATDKGTITLTLHDSNKGRQVEGFRYRVFKDAVMQEMNEVRGNTVVLRLKGGVYRVELTVKETGCKLTKEVIIPENPVPVQVKAISQIATDCNYERAVAQVEVNGGTAPYNLVLTHKATGKVYSESVQTNTINFNNLEAGTYYVRATDSVGCSAETSVLITVGKNMTATGLRLTTTPPTCTGEKDATLSFSAITTGGIAPYSYKLEKLNTEKHAIIPITDFNSNGTLVEGLSSGIYRLYVEDSKGCQLTLTTTAIYDPYPISAQINLTKSVFRSCNGEKTGSVVITNIQGGTGQYKVYIVSYDRKKVIDRKDNVKEGDTVTFEGLAPLENVYYEVVIQDSNKCLFLNFTPFLVKDESRIAIESVKGEYVCDPASEKGYTILLTVKFKNAEVDFTDLVYSIDNNHVMPFTRTEGNVAYIDNFTAITDVHTIEVSHKGGITNSVCPNTIANFSLSPLSPFTLERVPNDELNTIEVIAKGGKTNDLQGYTYYFNGENNGSNPVYKVRNNTPERLEDGVRIKMVEVIAVDAEGCRRKLMVEIPYIDVDIPNNFTPNGDGTNDRWKPNNLKDYPNALVHIYDRYGRRMATLKPGETWDGVYEGRHMPSGDYWYVIDLNDALIDGRKIYGHFSLYR